MFSTTNVFLQSPSYIPLPVHQALPIAAVILEPPLFRFERQKFLTKACGRIRKGKGTHLSGLPTLMGCPQRHYPQFANALRANHAVLFEQALMEPADSERLLVGITRIIERYPDLSGIFHLHGC